MDIILTVIKGDITKVEADAIVNAANTSLLGGSGVDGAIHRAGGKDILEDCQKIRNKQGKCKIGEAVITTGGNLPAKFVIHAVGPVWSNGTKNETELLTSAYTNSLNLAIQNNIETIAFPNISTGIYKFPKKEAAIIAINTVNSFEDNLNIIKEIIFVCYDDENYTIYNNILKK
ncbi:O-acetyl-ADP-ribose deacetylase [Flavobacterium circumlabens]|uniref:O-acetyl-ADP-ribose deacetylase n=1 Tax=Flavobacterium circumlabens TaxID=2133765 RepID=A0A4Y7U5R1_9FLAO|nr:O-acetyl-ADP-ribose deacetylase [Flavobacterium circumlabens]TCN50531.1 O-acetyl-ADP-ribose deacetylase (regulator of RNase III) [Flavobacterium circumlabens]TEB41783.1 O-acetyl-ADP-ribose deacetylase [Flavobacterium circumlabens]